MTGGLASRLVRAYRLADPPRRLAAMIVGCGLLAAFLEAIALALFMPLVRSLTVSPGVNSTGGFLERLAGGPLSVSVVAVGLVLSIIGKNVAGFVGGYAARRADGVVAHRLRVRGLSQTLSSCIDLRMGARMTDVVTTLANNTWKVSQALSLCWRVIICAATAAVFASLLFSLSLRLTLIALTALAATAVLVHVATRRAEALGALVVEENRAFGLRLWEIITALPLIRAFGHERYELGRFRAASERVRRRILRLDVMWSFPGPLAEILAVILIAGLVLTGHSLGVSLPTLAAFLAVLYRLQGPVREFLACKVALEGLGPALDDVETFLADTDTPLIATGSEPAPPLAQGVELRGVAFRYSMDEAPALQDLALSLPAGRTTAIVGRSGAGKSTLMSLLLRLRDPTEGRIYVDDVPLDQIDLAAWRAVISLMPQEAQLFHASVAENIGYGDLSATRERIREAARIAGAAEFIDQLPQGYETLVGDRGMRLSGGQRQRIALARTILRDPRLLLLDEPTNALDPETERAFSEALAQFAEGRTVVVIAHRLSTVMAADQVVVLEAGKVAEIGSPAELVGRPGLFARLHSLEAGRPVEAA